MNQDYVDVVVFAGDVARIESVGQVPGIERNEETGSSYFRYHGGMVEEAKGLARSAGYAPTGEFALRFDVETAMISGIKIEVAAHRGSFAARMGQETVEKSDFSLTRKQMDDIESMLDRANRYASRAEESADDACDMILDLKSRLSKLGIVI